MMLHAIENFIIGALSAAWADLIEQDRERGGSGRLQDAAITLTRGRTIITVVSDFHDDDRRLTASFELSEPLPASMREPLCQFLLDLHQWPRATLH